MHLATNLIICLLNELRLKYGNDHFRTVNAILFAHEFKYTKLKVSIVSKVKKNWRLLVKNMNMHNTTLQLLYSDVCCIEGSHVKISPYKNTGVPTIALLSCNLLIIMTVKWRFKSIILAKLKWQTIWLNSNSLNRQN